MEKKEAKVKPIFLFADSQVLFWKEKDGLFLNRVLSLLNEGNSRKEFKAAYIGASNGDKPEYYEIFVSAMAQIKITKCRMIPTKPSTEDKKYLSKADIILLAGGDIERGLKIIKNNGLHEKILEQYYNGAIVIGVSAGAVQLGLKGWRISKEKNYFLIDTFKIIPYVIDVHDEGDWSRLNQAVAESEKYTKGFGIPAGGGAIFHPDWSIEAVRHSLTEFSFLDDGIKQSIILPPDSNFEKNKNITAQIE
jgi:cyanophycinase-like exopeptidase